MTSVVVVDDQELVRTGFALILERAGMAVLGEARNGNEAHRGRARDRRPTSC